MLVKHDEINSRLVEELFVTAISMPLLGIEYLCSFGFPWCRTGRFPLLCNCRSAPAASAWWSCGLSEDRLRFCIGEIFFPPRCMRAGKGSFPSPCGLTSFAGNFLTAYRLAAAVDPDRPNTWIHTEDRCPSRVVHWGDHWCNRCNPWHNFQHFLRSATNSFFLFFFFSGGCWWNDAKQNRRNQTSKACTLKLKQHKMLHTKTKSMKKQCVS